MNQPPIYNQPLSTNQTLINSQAQKNELTKIEKSIKATWNICRWIWVVVILVIATGALAAALATSLDDFNKNVLVKGTGWLLSPALGARLLVTFIGIFIIITTVSGILAWRIKEMKETPDSDYIQAISTSLKDTATNSAQYNKDFVEYRRLLIETLTEGKIFASFIEVYKKNVVLTHNDFVQQNTALNENIKNLTTEIINVNKDNLTQIEALNNNLKSLTAEVVNLRQDNLAHQKAFNENLEELVVETRVGASMLKQYVQQSVLSNLPPEQLTT